MANTRHPEMRLLLALCGNATHRSGARDASEEVSRHLDANIDWNRFFVLSMWHKVAFLAFDRLRTLRLLDEAVHTAGLPLLLLNHWKQLHAINLMRNERMLGELKSITGALAQNGIPYAIGKGGPLLIGTVYSKTARKMYDLDLLAPRDSLDGVIEALREIDYHMGRYSHDEKTLEPLSKKEMRHWLLLARGLPNFHRQVDAPELEVSIAQVQFFVGSTGRTLRRIPAERLIAESSPVTVYSASPFTARGPQPTDLLIQLCLHISRELQDPEHSDWGMGWNLVKFCDLQGYAAHARVDGAHFANRANELDLVEHCMFALETALQILPDEEIMTLLEALRKTPSSSDTANRRASDNDVIARLDGVLGPPRHATSGWSKLVGTKSS